MRAHPIIWEDTCEDRSCAQKKIFFLKRGYPQKWKKSLAEKKMAREKKNFIGPFFSGQSFFLIFEGTPF